MITNIERRKALNVARTQALEFAQLATAHYVKTSEDGPEVTLAIMWATVAEALKDGDPQHDGVDPVNGVTQLHPIPQEEVR
jgi:hypothetical protein